MASASTWPQSRQVVLDLNGDVVPGALLRFYEAGTTTPLTVYSDPDLATPLTFPIEADANGRWPRVYLPYEDYREFVTTPDGMLLWNDDGIANPAPPTVDTTVPVSERMQTGMLGISFGPQDGYVRLNGLTIGNGSSGATERANDDTKPLYVYLYENLEDAVAPVLGGRGSNAETDYASGKALTLPNFQGRALAAIIGMGGAASTILDAVTFTAGAKDKAGSTAGVATHVLTASQLPAHDHSINMTPGFNDITVSVGIGSINLAAGATPVNTITSATPTTSPNSISIVGNTGSVGSGDAHPNMQPTGLVYLLVKL